MKALTIRQPWASLICYGIKDVENRSWKTNFRGKLLIHSSSFKCKEDFPYALMLEHGNAVLNDVTFGNIDLKIFPSSAIIGYVELSDCVEGNYDSIWASAGNYQFVLKNAHFFDEPIMGVKGKLNLFDYDLDENNLPPSHKVELRYPKIENDELIIPVSNQEFERDLKDEKINFVLYETDYLINLFFDRSGEDNKFQYKENIKNLTKVRLQAKDGREKTFKLLGIEFLQEKDENEEAVMVESIYGDKDESWYFVVSFE